MREPLETVRWHRQRAIDDVRQSLAASLAAASSADAEARTAERSIEAEATRASDTSGDDNLVEAFAAWLPGARHRVAQARALQERHEAEANRHRAELAICRTAMEAIETLINNRKAEASAIENRREQHALDEAAARTARPIDDAKPG